MKHAAQKLKSQRGASLLFALLVFLLCALAGAAALTAAGANVGRYTRLEHDQQQYLSVSSAAQLLRDELGAQQVIVTRNLVETYEWWYVKDATAEPAGPAAYTLREKRSYALEDHSVDFVSSDLPDTVQNALGQYLAGVFDALDVPPEFYTRTDDPSGSQPRPTPQPAKTQYLRITGQDGEDWSATLGSVLVEMTPQLDYSIRANIFTGEDKDLYDTELLLPASVARTLETKVTVDDTPSAAGPLPDGAVADSYGKRVTTTTVKVTITWPPTEVLEFTRRR